MSDDSLVRHEASHYAMGTLFSVAAYAPSSICLEKSVDQAFQEIDRLDALMSHYKPDSELSQINRLAFDQAVVVTPELFALLERAFRCSEETGGAFDITVGPLMKSWGFFQGLGRVPTPSELAQVIEQIGHGHVRLDAASRTVKFDMPGMELDPGAIGKGYAIDRAIELLRADGIARALVSSGTSSIYALGAPPGEQGWEISLCHPLDRRRQITSLRLRNLSISTSGDYEKSFALGGRRYAHLLDPASGTPVEDILMCAVIGSSNTSSDALSTAFFVAGIERSRAYLEHHPDLIAMFYLPGDRAGSVEQVVQKSSIIVGRPDRFVQL